PSRASWRGGLVAARTPPAPIPSRRSIDARLARCREPAPSFRRGRPPYADALPVFLPAGAGRDDQVHWPHAERADQRGRRAGPERRLPRRRLLLDRRHAPRRVTKGGAVVEKREP